MAARPIMIQGTGSYVGKSVVTAALCRYFRLTLETPQIAYARRSSSSAVAYGTGFVVVTLH